MSASAHGRHDYSTFSASIIRKQPTIEDETHNAFILSQCFCFLCRLSSSLTLHPVGPFRCFWDLFVMILLIYTSIEIPFTISFGQADIIKYIGLFVDGFLLLDIFLNFHTAYFDKYDNLRLVTNKKVCPFLHFLLSRHSNHLQLTKYICKKYFRTWFLIDFITCIPFEFIFDADETAEQQQSENTSQAFTYFKVLRIFRLLRIVKILRVVKMLRIFDAFMRQFIIREVVIFMKLFKIVFGMLMFAHFAACLWWFVGTKTSPSWIDVNGLREGNIPIFTKYSYAWYWAVVTLFTTGYGDVVATPKNVAEQWTCSVCILIGTCFFAYFVGTLTVLITEVYQQHTSHLKQRRFSNGSVGR